MLRFLEALEFSFTLLTWSSCVRVCDSDVDCFCDFRDVCACSFVSCSWFCTRLFSVICIEIRRFVTCRIQLRSRSDDPSSSYFVDRVCSYLWLWRWRVSSDQCHVIFRHSDHNVIREKSRVWDDTFPNAIQKHLHFKKCNNLKLRYWYRECQDSVRSEFMGVNGIFAHASSVFMRVTLRTSIDTFLDVVILKSSFDAKSFHDHECTREQEYFEWIEVGFHERFLSHSPSHLQLTLFRSQTSTLWHKNSIIWSYDHICSCFCNHNYVHICQLSCSVIQRGSAQTQSPTRRDLRVIRELHTRCPCVLSTFFLRGMNWSSCSTGFVLICRELVVTVSFCVRVCLCFWSFLWRIGRGRCIRWIFVMSVYLLFLFFFPSEIVKRWKTSTSFKIIFFPIGIFQKTNQCNNIWWSFDNEKVSTEKTLTRSTLIVFKLKSVRTRMTSLIGTRAIIWQKAYLWISPFWIWHTTEQNSWFYDTIWHRTTVTINWRSSLVLLVIVSLIKL